MGATGAMAVRAALVEVHKNNRDRSPVQAVTGDVVVDHAGGDIGATSAFRFTGAS